MNEIEARAIDILKPIMKQDIPLAKDVSTMWMKLELMRKAIREDNLNEAERYLREFRVAIRNVWEKVSTYKFKIPNEDIAILLKYVQVIGDKAEDEFNAFWVKKAKEAWEKIQKERRK